MRKQKGPGGRSAGRSQAGKRTTTRGGSRSTSNKSKGYKGKRTGERSNEGFRTEKNDDRPKRTFREGSEGNKSYSRERKPFDKDERGASFSREKKYTDRGSSSNSERRDDDRPKKTYRRNSEGSGGYDKGRKSADRGDRGSSFSREKKFTGRDASYNKRFDSQGERIHSKSFSDVKKAEKEEGAEEPETKFTNKRNDKGRYARIRDFEEKERKEKPDDRDGGFSDERPAYNRERSADSNDRGDERKPYQRRTSSENTGERPSYNRGRSSDREDKGEEKRSYRKKTSGDDEGRSSYNRERSADRNDRGDERKPYQRRTSSESTGERPSYNRGRSNEGEDRGEEKRSYRKKTTGDDEGRPSYSRERSADRNDRDDERKPYQRRESSDSGSRYADRNKGRGSSRDGDDRKESSSYRQRDGDDRGRDDERKPFEKGEFSKSRKAYAASAEKRFSGDRKEKKISRPRTAGTAYKGSKGPGDKLVRLNKFIANTGICSRREADELITAGVVSVNGNVVTELGFKVSPFDEIRYNNEVIKTERPVYLLLNKPKDFITTTDDPQERRTVMSLIKGACRERIYPVGRLDRATTGLLLFTNDGEMTKKLTHPSGRVKKIYHVELDRPVKAADMRKISEGIELEDGFAKVDDISYVGDDKAQVGVELHSGKNRIVRRIFESLDYKVVKLDRVYFGGLTKKDLTRGKWRFLTDMELNMMKML